MAKIKMNRVEIVGLNKERKRLIEHLQRCGTVDITDSKMGILESRETVQTISKIESSLAATASAIEMLPAEKGGFFSKRAETDIEKSALSEGEVSEMTGLINEIRDIEKQRQKNKDERAALLLEEETAKSFLKLDISPSIKKTAKTAIRIVVCDGEQTEESLWQKLHHEEIEAVHFEILNVTKQQTVIWFVYLKSEEAKLSKLFAELNMISPKALSKDIPSERLKEIEKRLSEIDDDNERLSDKLQKLSEKRKALELYYDKLLARRDKYKALSNIGITKDAFFISGYLPEKACDSLKTELEKMFTVSVEFAEPDESEDVPVAFKNNGIAQPVEGITSDYSMPSRHDIDPNPIMAIFYYFFFGMMFSDAGYGLLLIIVCGILGYSQLLDKAKRGAYRMFFFCGISTTFWGIMYGSFFGDMIPTVTRVFGGAEVAFSPILVDPVKKPLFVLIMSVAFGAIHILTAMAIKFYVTWKNGEKLAAIFDTGFWMVVIIGIGVLATGKAMGIDIAFKIGEYMAIAGAAGLVLTQGRTSKNPIMKLINGILSLYDITSIVGDLLSYSRLMALGLATGVIASVINVLGSLGGSGIAGLIGFIVISIFGHLLNFAINMLGAYVHTNRLQYVEFYQKFYEGGGKKYQPLTFNTKYNEFK